MEKKFSGGPWPLLPVEQPLNTRHCRDLQKARYRTEFANNRFQYTALKAWNDISAQLSELSTLNSYKKELNAYLKS